MWGISWVPWGVFSTVGDIMSTVGVILSTVGMFSTVGDIMSTVGDIILWNLSTMGDIMIHVGDIMSTMGVFSTVGYSNNKRLSPHGTEHPPQYSWYPPHASWYPPTCIMISPMVLNIPHSTQDNPHGTHDIPHSTEHPPQYSRYPHIYHDIPHGTEHPHSTEHPHGTAHTLYRVIIEFSNPCILGCVFEELSFHYCHYRFAWNIIRWKSDWVCEIPSSFERASPSNFRTQGSFIHMNCRKIFERDLLSSDSVAKSATQKPWVVWDWTTTLRFIRNAFMIMSSPALTPIFPKGQAANFWNSCGRLQKLLKNSMWANKLQVFKENLFVENSFKFTSFFGKSAKRCWFCLMLACYFLLRSTRSNSDSNFKYMFIPNEWSFDAGAESSFQDDLNIYAIYSNY